MSQQTGGKTQDEQAIRLSIVIPAYNEEKRLPKTLLAIDHYISRQEYSYEILVVNDGSKDHTTRVVERFQSLINNLRLIDNKENHGKGYVVRQGMLDARGGIRLFMDADGATSIDHIEKMWPHFDTGADVVIGSRDSRDAAGAMQAVRQSFARRLLGDIGNLLIQFVAVRGIWDTQNGFKAFTAKAAEDIFSRTKIQRWGFDIEALALARAFGYRIEIVPVHWVNDPNSHVTWRGYLNTFRELFLVRLNLWRGIYRLSPRAKIRGKPAKNIFFSSLLNGGGKEQNFLKKSGAGATNKGASSSRKQTINAEREYGKEPIAKKANSKFAKNP